MSSLEPRLSILIKAGNVLLFNGQNPAEMGDTQVGRCIFKTKHVACKITSTGLRCFLNLKQYATFFHCPVAAVKSAVSV